MKQRVIRYAVMIVALAVFIYSAYSLTLIYIESKESMDVYDEVKNMFISDGQGGELLTDEYGVTLSNSSTGGVFTWDYAKMLSYNPESLGYIRQDNGDYIDNPILQHSDNDYYLGHLANNQVSSVGSIYVDYRIEEGLEARNAIIYGHNMGRRVKNIMFGSLNWYYYCADDPEYYLHHPTFDIYVGYKHYKYYVFAAYKTDSAGSSTYTYSFENDEAYMAYIKDCLNKSKHKFEQAGEITATDKIVTLSTCTESDEKRMIVQAVRREQIDDVPNVPDSETMTATRGAVSIGETTETGTETTAAETTTGQPTTTVPATQATQKQTEPQATQRQTEKVTEAPTTTVQQITKQTEPPTTVPPETTTAPPLPETTTAQPETEPPTEAPPETEAPAEPEQ